MRTFAVALFILCLTTEAQAGCGGGVVHLKAFEDGSIYWNQIHLKTRKEIRVCFKEAVDSGEQPEIHLDLQPKTNYRTVYMILQEAQKAGLNHLGFTGLDQGPPN